MTKLELQSLAKSVLDYVDSCCNLDGIENYGAMINVVASVIASKVAPDVEFTDEECGL